MRFPQQVGDYELIGRLGSGSFGTVYRARIRGELGFSQEVAVKLVDAGQARERPAMLTALADEAHFLSRIAHPNIVSVRRFARAEHDFLGDVHMLEMELVRGAPLSAVLRRLRTAGLLLPVEAVLGLLLEAADALRYAHELRGDDGRPRGLVHRDLKPDNLLVSEDGRLKVLDFGIAWAEDRIASRTETGLAKGTPLYMSPEQARGQGADARVDLYALGAIAFELLAGQWYIPPPEGGFGDLPALLFRVVTTTWSDREPVLREALTAPPPSGRGLPRDRAEPLVALLGDLLAGDVSLRAPSAHAVLHRLEALASEWPLHLGRRYLRALFVEPGEDEGEASGALTGSEEVELRTWARTLPSADATEEDPEPAEATTRGPVATPPRAPAGQGPSARRPAHPPMPTPGPTRLVEPGPPPRPSSARLAALAVVGAAVAAAWLLLGRQEPSAPPAEVADAETPAAPDPTPTAELAATPEAEPTPAPSAAPGPAATPAGTSPPPPPRDSPAPMPTVAEAFAAPRPDPTPEPVRWPTATATAPIALFPGTPSSFDLALAGGTVSCVPELYVSARGAGRYGLHRATRREEGRWSVSVPIPYGEGYEQGADYFFRCCTEARTCGDVAGSRARPLRLEAAAF